MGVGKLQHFTSSSNKKREKIFKKYWVLTIEYSCKLRNRYKSDGLCMRACVPNNKYIKFNSCDITHSCKVNLGNMYENIVAKSMQMKCMRF